MEDYKKKYEEVLDRVKYIIGDDDDAILNRTDIEDIFPELKESEDERIREEILAFIKREGQHIDKYKWPKWIDWLEKHGEQKPTDKIKPKFKVGDWCIDDEDGTIFQIVKVLDNTYAYKTSEGKAYSCTHYSLENDARLWTIQDAKPGDVLQLGNVTAIFKDYLGNEHCKCYCSLCEGKFEVPTKDESYGTINSRPATKEQQNLLFQKMKEAGYEWDAEKLEQKKVTTNTPAWTDDDEKKLNMITELVENRIDDEDPGEMTYEAHRDFYLEHIGWLKSLKTRTTTVINTPDYIRRLIALQDQADRVYTHIEADNTLCELLEKLGYKEIVEEYKKVDKRYIKTQAWKR